MTQRSLTRREALAASLTLFGAGGCGLQFARPGPKRSQALAASLIEQVARAYALDSSENGDFHAAWDLSQRLTRFAGEEGAKQLREEEHQQALSEVAQAARRLKAACDGKASDALGHRRVRWEPLQGRSYVIFSDHHITHRGHRHNFFASGGNLWIYAAALERYRDAGFTLVENGDVEDLVIYESKLEPQEAKRRATLSLEELQRRRLEVRLRQLERIYGDPQNRPWVEAIRRFDEEGRLIRIAGNHDYDLQREAFAHEVAQHLPNLRVPSDYLLLHDDTGEKRQARYAVMHGHQFDLATNPVSAPRVGETISECLGLYFQGPDRVWRWHNEVAAWATGARPFSNTLSTDPTDWGADLEVPQVGDLTAEQRLFRQVFKHTIAWEYFHSADDPIKAVQEEVLTGERFFKFRHMDEMMIAARMEQAFPDPAARPTLILGHSHEPRIKSVVPGTRKIFDHYMNSAAAGRFENLLWAIEIVDGRATMVSWSCMPPPHGDLERRTWNADELGTLRAAAHPQSFR